MSEMLQQIRQIADELDNTAAAKPCSEAEILRDVASYIERLEKKIRTALGPPRVSGRRADEMTAYQLVEQEKTREAAYAKKARAFLDETGKVKEFTLWSLKREGTAEDILELIAQAFDAPTVTG